jgi:hypothetical protein
MIIQDPATSRGANVDALGRIYSLADARTAAVRASIDGDFAIFYSTYSATAADEIFYFLSNDEHSFYVERIVIATDTAGSFTLAECSGTAAGTGITGTNPRLGHSIDHQYSAFGNAAVTGLTPGVPPFITVQLPANGSVILPISGELIVGNGQDFCITTNVTAVVHVSVMGFWASVY